MSAAAASLSPSRGFRYHLLGPKCIGKGLTGVGPLATKASSHETKLLRWLGLCTGGLLLLDIWVWIAPGVLAPRGTEHTVADFDTSSLLYLAPLTLHALAALAFFTRKPHPTLSLWTPAIRLRMASLACMALAIPTLVARVVTLQQYCRLEGRVAEKEPSAASAGEDGEANSLFKACSSGHVGANAAAMAVAYTVLGVLMLQALSHLAALARWQQQQQHHLRALHARQQARARRALSHDGHTPPGCQPHDNDGGDEEEEEVDFWPPEGDVENASYTYYAGPPPPFPALLSPEAARGAKRQRQQQRQRGSQPWTPTRGNGSSSARQGSSSASVAGGTASLSFGSSSLSTNTDSPDRYLHQARPSLVAGGGGSYYHPPGVSAAAAATARTLYGDVEQYDDPAPRVLVHHHNHHHHDEEEEEDRSVEGAHGHGHSPGTGTGTGTGASNGSGSGSGDPLTLSSGGQASAFSSYVAATTTTD